MSTGKKIRVLKGGLTFGSEVYKAGDFLKPQHFSPNVHEYASGRKLMPGKERVLEYADEDQETPTLKEAVEAVKDEPTPKALEGLAHHVTPKQLAEAGAFISKVGEVQVETPEQVAKLDEALDQVMVHPPEAPRAPESLPPSEDKPPSDEDLADAKLTGLVLKAVSEGLAKGAIVSQVAKAEEYSQRQVGGEFDRLVDAGRIRASETERGKYTVAEQGQG